MDSGDTARTTSDPDYFPKWHPYYRRSVQMNIKPEEEIGPQLRKMGIGPKDVKTLMSFSFESVEKGTRLTDRWKLESGKPGLIEKLFKFKLKKVILQNLIKLKKLLESESVRLQNGRPVQT